MRTIMLLSDISSYLRLLFVTNGQVTLVVVIGAAAVTLLLPRPRRRSPRWGAVLAGLALVLTGGLLVRVETITPATLLFYAFSAIAVLAGGLLITQANPARAALSFTLVVLSTCGLFLLLAAPFLMAGTTIIYAGAIVVTFLFVLMLAQQEGLSDADQRSREPVLSTVAGFVLLAALLYVLNQTYGSSQVEELRARARRAAEQDTVAAVKEALGDEKQFFETFETALLAQDHTPERALRNRLATVRNDYWVVAKDDSDLDKMKAALHEFDQIGQLLQMSAGVYQPSGNIPLSAFSGPPANVPLHPPADNSVAEAGEEGSGGALRRKADGTPQLPAENVAYLGRSLYTDYLLPVEMGGTLLLVATIGAIAIAARRTERAP
jgi:NADH:ubiquinone oxidoreductase subunit 6 (subunit J)